MRTSVAMAIVFALLSASAVFAQNAQLGGIVTDPTGALNPSGAVHWTPSAHFMDGNIQKSFRINERSQLSLRLDATNILNHPQLNSPNFTVGATPFGQIAGKGAATFAGPPVQRNFQAQVRITF